MNKSLPPTIETVNAIQAFATFLNTEMERWNISEIKLAKDIGLERKTIMAYKLGQRPPKLDVMARIYAYFGHRTITISLDDAGGINYGKKEDNNSSNIRPVRIVGQ